MPSRLGVWYYAALTPLLCLLVFHLRRTRLQRRVRSRVKKLRRMRFLFTRRRLNAWFRLKVLVLVHIWALCDSPVRSRLSTNALWRRRWSLVLLAARYGVIFPAYPLTVMGLAGKLEGEPEITVGLEPQMTKLRAFRGTVLDGNLLRQVLARISVLARPLRSSAIDHELMHCLEQYFDEALEQGGREQDQCDHMAQIRGPRLCGGPLVAFGISHHRLPPYCRCLGSLVFSPWMKSRPSIFGVRLAVFGLIIVPAPLFIMRLMHLLLLGGRDIGSEPLLLILLGLASLFTASMLTFAAFVSFFAAEDAIRQRLGKSHSPTSEVARSKTGVAKISEEWVRRGVTFFNSRHYGDAVRCFRVAQRLGLQTPQLAALRREAEAEVLAQDGETHAAGPAQSRATLRGPFIPILEPVETQLSPEEIARDRVYWSSMAPHEEANSPW